MAPTTNWLSFSLSPLEMLRSSESTQFMPFDSSSSSSPQYLIDNFYAPQNHSHGWNNPKSQMLLSEEELENLHHHHHHHHNQGKAILTSFVDSERYSTIPGNQTIPKLEDFLGECSQTETQDSSLTQIYDQAVAGFQAFSANSGSEVDDSASIARTNQLAEFAATHSVESTRSELAFSSSCPVTTVTGSGRSLTLAVQTTSQTQNSAPEKTIVASDYPKNKISDTFGQRTSIYRGVTRHRWTGRYEAHLWDNSCRREGQARKGRQVYLGGYDKEDKAARAYDLAALKYWGLNATTNFPVSTYTQEIEDMKNATKQEFIASLRRKSSGFSRGASMYRGVTRHHQQGRWQARIGRVAGNKDLYLGTFATEEEAAEAYDIAAIKFRGANAVTNFEMNRYDVEAISKSSLPVGGAAKRLKLSLESSATGVAAAAEEDDGKSSLHHNNNNIDFSAIQPVSTGSFDSSAAAAALYHQNYYHHFHHHPQTYLLNPEPSAPAGSLLGPTSATVPSEFYLWPHHHNHNNNNNQY